MNTFIVHLMCSNLCTDANWSVTVCLWLSKRSWAAAAMLLACVLLRARSTTARPRRHASSFESRTRKLTELSLVPACEGMGTKTNTSFWGGWAFWVFAGSDES